MIIFLFFQIICNFTQFFLYAKNFINVWVCFQQRFELFFGKIMDFCVWDLLFKTSYYRRSQYNISYGAKTNDEDFLH